MCEVKAWDDVCGVLSFSKYVNMCEYGNKKGLFAQLSMTMTILLFCRVVCPVHV
jgi:hypothetical protein